MRKKILLIILVISLCALTMCKRHGGRKTMNEHSLNNITPSIKNEIHRSYGDDEKIEKYDTDETQDTGSNLLDKNRVKVVEDRDSDRKKSSEPSEKPKTRDHTVQKDKLFPKNDKSKVEDKEIEEDGETEQSPGPTVGRKPGDNIEIITKILRDEQKTRVPVTTTSVVINNEEPTTPKRSQVFYFPTLVPGSGYSTLGNYAFGVVIFCLLPILYITI